MGLLYDIMTSSPGIQNVCEVGFNSGHSALAFLEGIPNSRVISFDLGAHQYVTVAFEVLNNMYPDRLTLVLGDSKQTIADFIEDNPDFRCNLLFVDGSHEYDGVLHDLRNFRKMANQTFGHMVVVDDFGCLDPYCRHVRTAFYRMVNERQLQERRVITSVDYTHILGRRASPLTNGMATGIFLVDSQPPADADPDWLPFHW